jgi:hypothetical protein
MAEEYFQYDLRKDDGMLIEDKLAKKIVKKLKKLKDTFYLGVQNKGTGEECHTFQNGEEKIEIKPYAKLAKVYGKSESKIQEKVSTLEKLMGIEFY